MPTPALHHSATMASLPMYVGRRLNLQKQEQLAQILRREKEKSSMHHKFTIKYGAERAPDRLQKPEAASKSAPKTLKHSMTTPSLPQSVRVQVAPSLENCQQDPAKETTTARSDPSEYDSDGGRLPPPRNHLVKMKQRKSNELDWVSIMEFNKAVMELDRKADTELAIAARRGFKSGLDQQILDRDQRHSMELEQKHQELIKENQYYNAIQQEIEKESAQRKARILAEKEIRMRQIQANLERKKKGAEIKRVHNQQMLKRYQIEQVKMKKEAVDRKAREKAKLERVKMENELIEAKKAEEVAIAEREELARQKAYAAMIDQQERARAQFYEHKAQKQEKLIMVNDQANIQQLIQSTELAKEAARLADLKILDAQQEYHRKQDQIESEKQEKRKKVKAEIAIELKRQLEAREHQRQEQISLDLEYCEAVKKSLQRIDEREAAEKNQRKKKLLEQAEYLNNQMVELDERKVRERAAMSQTEIKFNSKILGKIIKGEILPSAQSDMVYRPY